MGFYFSVICDWILKRNGRTKLLKVVFGAGIIIFIYFHYKKKKKIYREFISSSEEEEELPVVPPNLAFYRNQIPSMPNGDYIENILTSWTGNYYLLETNHSFIQWLFPNQMPGVNPQAYSLMDEEAKIIRSTPVLRERVKRAFEMMLDFYGMRLTKDNQFELAENFEERLLALNQWGNHNFLRISRILLALKELGHKDLILPWMKFLADLIYKERLLDCAASSFEDYWLDTLDAEDKIQLNEYKNAMHLYE